MLRALLHHLGHESRWNRAVIISASSLKSAVPTKLAELQPDWRGLTAWAQSWRGWGAAWKELIKHARLLDAPPPTAMVDNAIVFACNVCSRTFGSKRALDSHCYKRHDKRCFGREFIRGKQCPVCSKTFRRVQYARDHVSYRSERCRLAVLDGVVDRCDVEEVRMADSLVAAEREIISRKGSATAIA